MLNNELLRKQWANINKNLQGELVISWYSTLTSWIQSSGSSVSGRSPRQTYDTGRTLHSAASCQRLGKRLQFRNSLLAERKLVSLGSGPDDRDHPLCVYEAILGCKVVCVVSSLARMNTVYMSTYRRLLLMSAMFTWFGIIKIMFAQSNNYF